MLSYKNSISELKREKKLYEQDIEKIMARLLIEDVLNENNSIETEKRKSIIRKELYEIMIKQYECQIEYIDKCLEYKSLDK